MSVSRPPSIRWIVKRIAGLLSLLLALLAVAAGGPLTAQGTAPRRPLPDYLRVERATRDTIALRSTIGVSVVGLDRAMRDSVAPLDPGRLVLYLDGRPLRGIPARLVRSGGTALSFDVTRAAADSTAWVALLGAPTGRDRRVTISTGLLEGGELPAVTDRPVQVTLRLFESWRLFSAALVVVVAIAAALWWLTRRQSFRERPTYAHSSAAGDRAYSLSRVQAAIWFVTIFGSFLFLYLLTGSYNGLISAQALVLLGISAATGVVSSGISRQKALAGTRRLAEIEAASAMSASHVADSMALGRARAQATGMLGKERTRGILSDLLDDRDGPTVYRFQYLLWTLVLATIFVVEVYRQLAMPSFDSALLVLMGISGGIYLGFKVPEQQASTGLPPTAPSAPGGLLPSARPPQLGAGAPAPATLLSPAEHDAMRRLTGPPARDVTVVGTRERVPVAVGAPPPASTLAVAQPPAPSRDVREEVITALGATPALADDLVGIKRAIERAVLTRVVPTLGADAQPTGIRASAADAWMNNLLGVGIGPVAQGEGALVQSVGAPGATALILYVVQPMRVEQAQAVVRQVADVSTDDLRRLPTIVVATGIIEARSHRGRIRPAPGGSSVAHHADTAGTLGCLAAGREGDRADRLLLLSNNHVLARCNAAAAGDCICQPGPHDVGRCPADRIADLERHVVLDFNGGANTVDAAVGWAVPQEVRPELMYVQDGMVHYFRVNRTIGRGVAQMRVGKVGRTTGLRYGHITDVAATVQVAYPSAGGRIASFVDQLAITGEGVEFSQPGDSGSLIWTADESRTPVGLLFAGGNGRTFANHIDQVCDALGITLST